MHSSQSKKSVLSYGEVWGYSASVRVNWVRCKATDWQRRSRRFCWNRIAESAWRWSSGAPFFEPLLDVQTDSKSQEYIRLQIDYPVTW